MTNSSNHIIPRLIGVPFRDGNASSRSCQGEWRAVGQSNRHRRKVGRRHQRRVADACSPTTRRDKRLLTRHTRRSSSASAIAVSALVSLPRSRAPSSCLPWLMLVAHASSHGSRVDCASRGLVGEGGGGDGGARRDGFGEGELNHLAQRRLAQFTRLPRGGVARAGRVGARATSHERYTVWQPLQA